MFTQELQAFSRKKLPGFACPEWVLIVDELPVSIMFWKDKHLADSGVPVITENVYRQNTQDQPSKICREALANTPL
jgi:hypothetical protein